MLGMEARGNSMDFKGKTALVTGGVSGIGFGIARAFCVAGIDLVLTYRNEDYRAQAQAWFEGNDHPMPRFVQLDVTDRARGPAWRIDWGRCTSSSTTPASASSVPPTRR